MYSLGFIYIFLFWIKIFTKIQAWNDIVLDVAVKSVDCSQSSLGMEDLQDKEGDRKWHRFGAGLGGSDAFVSTSL